MQTELFVLMQLSESNVTVVDIERTARGIRDETDATLVNRKTETKLWTADNLARAAFAEAGWGALYLDDVAVFDHFAQQLLVFRFILFLLQFCCMLKKTGTYYSFWLIIMLQELLRD